MLHILKEQKNILVELKELLIEEKQVLIQSDGGALNTLVHKKIELIERLDKSEKVRIEKYQDKKIDEIEIPIEEKYPVKKLAQDIKALYQEIQEYQKINIMLTQQSMDYQDTMMAIIKEAIEKSGNIYGESGKMENKKNASTTSLNTSV